MKITLFSLFLLFSWSPNALLAQGASELDGDWEGFLTLGGIQSTLSAQVQLTLKREGRWEVSGQSYVHLNDGRIIQMNLQGRIYRDFSMRIWEVEPDEEGLQAPYKRQYQLIFHPDLWDATLNGYWQEISPHPTTKGLQRGRILLKPKEKSGA